MATVIESTLGSFSAATHNGAITVSNPETGGHRTFEIATQKDDASFAPGERIISLLTGSDNENDFDAFGFVKNDGRIFVWKRFRGTVYETLADMVANPERWVDRVEYHVESTCRRCNRRLTTPESIESGIGPICAERESGGEF